MAVGKDILTALFDLVDRDITLMHICGTHEAAIARAGLRSILPERLKIVMGPGCPVCITPQGEIDAALDLVERGCTVADLSRISGLRLAEVTKHLRVLEEKGAVEPVREQRGVFYRVA